MRSLIYALLLFTGAQASAEVLRAGVSVSCFYDSREVKLNVGKNRILSATRYNSFEMVQAQVSFKDFSTRQLFAGNWNIPPMKDWVARSPLNRNPIRYIEVIYGKDMEHPYRQYFVFRFDWSKFKLKKVPVNVYELFENGQHGSEPIETLVCQRSKI